ELLKLSGVVLTNRAHVFNLPALLFSCAVYRILVVESSLCYRYSDHYFFFKVLFPAFAFHLSILRLKKSCASTSIVAFFFVPFFLFLSVIYFFSILLCSWFIDFSFFASSFVSHHCSHHCIIFLQKMFDPKLQNQCYSTTM